MPEIDKQVTFNAFHICIVCLALNLIFYGGNLDYIIQFINYVIDFNSPGSWFIILHVLTLYLILSSLQFDFGFRAAIKFNL